MFVGSQTLAELEQSEAGKVLKGLCREYEISSATLFIGGGLRDLGSLTLREPTGLELQWRSTKDGLGLHDPQATAGEYNIIYNCHVLPSVGRLLLPANEQRFWTFLLSTAYSFSSVRSCPSSEELSSRVGITSGHIGMEAFKETKLRS